MTSPRFELRAYPTAAEAGAAAARQVAALVAARLSMSENVVLGLSADESAVPLYAELVRVHRAERLSFSHVRTFGVGEYWPLPPHDPRSRHRFVLIHLLDLLDVAATARHVLDGDVPVREAPAHAAAYEERIRAAGGIDVQILGLGENGRVAFNEPGSPPDARTRLVPLTESTRTRLAPQFEPADPVPTHALTMGIGTILEARRLVLLAFGPAKREPVRRILEDPPTESFPATFLRRHPDVTIYVDQQADPRG